MQPKLVTQKQTLIIYFGFCYLINLYLCSSLIAAADTMGLQSSIFAIATIATYPATYLLPLLLSTLVLLPISNHYRIKPYWSWVFLITTNSLLSTMIFADARLFDLYGFHINAFVINLVLTPGGIASLGGGMDTYISACILGSSIWVGHGLLLFLAAKLSIVVHIKPSFVKATIALLLCLAITERVIYGISDSQLYGPVLKIAESIPLYNKVTFRSFAKKIGIEVASKQSGIKLKADTRKLNYPLAKLEYDQTTPPLNIIWLVSESMRWDLLSPEVMPHTYKQSQTGWRFKQHYSGGNGTRQGLFSLFYGIYGSYWDAFLVESRAPVFLDYLQNRQYELNMYTSASFTYPEFDKTLFANIPQSHLHPLSGGMPASERDRTNTDKIIRAIKQRDKSKPFMTFMFYESTHARYDFPAATALNTPYLDNLNYATMSRRSLAKDIEPLRNRYINAANFIDSQLQRIYETLTTENLWQNTIVMVTGDHGEEFMEKGFWGHNSGFSEEQIRTPMVLWMPNTQPRLIDNVSSHMDIIPTILPRLGVNNPINDYSLGANLAENIKHQYIIASDWAGLAFIGDGYKFSLPFKSTLSTRNKLTDNNDNEIDDFIPFFKAHKQDLDEILTNAALFKEK